MRKSAQRTPRPIVLQRRDLDILAMLAGRRVETLDAIVQRHFTSTSRARSRLAELDRARYIERHALLGARAQRLTVYRLGPSGPSALRLQLPSSVSLLSRARLPDGSLYHQLQLNRAADSLALELLASEQLASKTTRPSEPYGVYRAASPDRHGRELIRLTVELAQISRPRLLDDVDATLEHPDCAGLLIVTASPHRADQLSAWIRNARGESTMNRVQVIAFEEITTDRGLAPRLRPDRGASGPST